MMSRLFPDVELTIWPLVTVVAFSVAFVFLVFRTFAPSRKAFNENLSKLPLED